MQESKRGTLLLLSMTGILLPVLLFGAVSHVANVYDRNVGLPSLPFVNVDRWLQVRLQLLGLSAMAWIPLVGIGVVLPLLKIQAYVVAMLVIVWSIFILVVASILIW